MELVSPLNRVFVATLIAAGLLATVVAPETRAQWIAKLLRTYQDMEPTKPKFKSLREIRVNDPVKGEKIPDDDSKDLFKPASGDMHRRSWGALSFQWKPTEFWHHPVYWDYVPWDYYGQWSHPLVQPWLEGVHFFGTVPILPYKMGLDRPFSRVSSLGYYRPGNVAPRVRHRLPWQWDAAVWESAAWVSAAFIFP